MATTTDVAGNTATCAFSLTVVDVEPPQISDCPASATVPNDHGVASAWVNWVAPSATDNVGVSTWVETIDGSSSTDFSVNLALGVHAVSYVATDASGNSAQCEFSITVVDAEPPQFQYCPSSFTQSTDAGLPTATVTWTSPVVTDIVQITSVTSNKNSGDTFQLGDTDVQYIVVDSGANMAVCIFTVTIIDTEQPVIHDCPSNIDANTDINEPYATVSWVVPTETDNVGATLSDSAEPGSEFPIGTTTVVYVAADAAGNTATCQFTITVTDIQPPMINNCPSGQTVPTDLNENYATVTWPALSVTDSADPNPNVVSSANSGDQFPYGVNNVVITATDIYGNVATCQFSIHVTDTQGPMLNNCPSSIVQNTDLDEAYATVGWTAPTAADNVQIVGVVSSANPGDQFLIGVTTVTYTATDEAENTDNCQFTITVVDNQAPSFTYCPGNIVASSTQGEPVQVSWSAPTAWDNSGTVLLAYTIASGSFFEVGQSRVTFIANDPSDNTAQCVFTVTVVNNCANVVCSNNGNPCLLVPTCFNGTCPTTYNDNIGCTPSDPRGTNGVCQAGSCAAQGFIASFGASSFISLPTLHDMYITADSAWELEVSFQFKTVNLEGNLFIVGNTEPNRNYLRIYLLGGHLYVSMQLGTGVGTVTTSGTTAPWNDGNWHQVVFSKLNAHGTLSVDSNTFKFTSPGSGHQLKVSGPPATYNVIIGAIPSNYVAAISPNSAATSTAQQIDVSESFKGCMQQLVINGQSVSLDQAVAGPTFAASYDLLQCYPTQPITIPSFDGSSAFMAFPLLVEPNNATTATLQVSFTFTTTMQNGFLLWNRAVKQADYIGIYLQGGAIVLSLNLGVASASVTAACTMCSYGDGQPHTVWVNLVNQNAYLQVDTNKVAVTVPGSARVLNPDQPLYMGGLSSAEFSNVASRGLNPQGFSGCMWGIKINSQPLALTSNTSSLDVFQCGQEQYFHTYQVWSLFVCIA